MKITIAPSVVLFLIFNAAVVYGSEIIPSGNRSHVGLAGPLCKDAFKAVSSTQILRAAISAHHADDVEPSFTKAFTFSSDGNFLTTRHYNYPNIEHVSVVSLHTGEIFGSFSWRSPKHTMGELKSVVFDNESRQITAVADVLKRSNNFDELIVWDAQSSQPVEQIDVQQAAEKNYRPVLFADYNSTYRTDLSSQHPFYVRTHLKVSGSDSGVPSGYASQLIDWRNKRIVDLPDTSVDYLKIVPEPINSRFGYIVTLLANGKTLHFRSLETIFNESGKPGAGVRSKLGHFVKSLLPKPRTGETGRDELVYLPNQSGSPSLSNGVRPDNSRQSQESTETHRRNKALNASSLTETITHTDRIVKVRTSNHAPFIVTQTNSALHIWNIRTGKEIRTIPVEAADFRLLENSSLLAYVDKNGTLRFDSLIDGQTVAEFSQFPKHALDQQIDNRQPGDVYITTTDGVVHKISESSSQLSSKPRYSVASVNLGVFIPPGISLRTVVATEKSAYFLQISEHRGGSTESGKIRKLEVEVYDVSASGKKITSLLYPMENMIHPQFQLDPTGTKLVFTSESDANTLIHLNRVLRENNL